MQGEAQERRQAKPWAGKDQRWGLGGGPLRAGPGWGRGTRLAPAGTSWRPEASGEDNRGAEPEGSTPLLAHRPAKGENPGAAVCGGEDLLAGVLGRLSGAIRGCLGGVGHLGSGALGIILDRLGRALGGG